MQSVQIHAGTAEIAGFGWTAFAVGDKGLVQTASFFRSSEDALKALPAFLASRRQYIIHPDPWTECAWWQDACIQYFANGWSAVNPERVPLDSRDWNPFQKAVYFALRDNVHWGETISYGELAGLAGYPGAARAVGTAMSRNMCGPFIPCHRVIGAHGKLGGFSGSGGPTLKKRLLDMERQR